MLRLSVQHPDFSNETLAEALGLSAGAVKKTWQFVYERVSKAAPDLLPPPESEQGRGLEKRRRLLQYLREHPEELRPYKPPRPKAAPRVRGR